MKTAASLTREHFPLSYKKIIKKTITGTLWWAITILMIGIFAGMPAYRITGASSLYLDTIVPISIVLLLIVSVLIYFYQRWYFAVYYYDIQPDHLVIKKGPITPHEITIPYERFQEVYLDQDIWDRILGLYDVHVSSATTFSGMQAHIDGVGKRAAGGLRAALLAKVNQRIAETRQFSAPKS